MAHTPLHKLSERSETITNNTAITKDNRNKIGENLLNFCGNYEIFLVAGLNNSHDVAEEIKENDNLGPADTSCNNICSESVNSV